MNQKNIPIDASQALQPLGLSVEYLRAKHSGKNSIDFLITFHLGQLANLHLASRFWIVSKDRDINSPVSHLCAAGFKCSRVVSITQIFTPTIERTDRPIERIIQHLSKMKAAKPRRTKTLRSTIAKVLGVVDTAEVEALVGELRERGVLSEAQGKVTYASSKASSY